MDWSHLKMPFVLSLFPPTAFTLLLPYLFSVAVVVLFSFYFFG